MNFTSGKDITIESGAAIQQLLFLDEVPRFRHRLKQTDQIRFQYSRKNLTIPLSSYDLQDIAFNDPLFQALILYLTNSINLNCERDKLCKDIWKKQILPDGNHFVNEKLETAVPTKTYLFSLPSTANIFYFQMTRKLEHNTKIICNY